MAQKVSKIRTRGLTGKGTVLRHIGIVVDRKRHWSNRYMVLHNIGSGPKIEDVLFDWKINGHFRYYGEE